jgi:hypothetical protein
MTGRLLLASVLLAGALSGCASQEDTYCDAVKQHQTELGRIADEGGPDALLKELPTLESLAGEAPSDIKDEWQTVVTAVRALDQAFDDAGVDPATYDAKHPPADLSDDDRRQIESAASDLGSDSVLAATGGIEQEALDICKTPLGL